jgi:hypothetical protein
MRPGSRASRRNVQTAALVLIHLITADVDSDHVYLVSARRSVRARHAVEQGSIVVDRARKHAHEHDAVVLDPNDLTHRRLSLFVTDKDVPPRCYRQPAASISNVAVGEPISISAVVVQPQIPGRHANSLLRAPGVGDRKIEANLEPIEGRAPSRSGSTMSKCGRSSVGMSAKRRDRSRPTVDKLRALATQPINGHVHGEEHRDRVDAVLVVGVGGRPADVIAIHLAASNDDDYIVRWLFVSDDDRLHVSASAALSLSSSPRPAATA